MKILMSTSARIAASPRHRALEFTQITCDVTRHGLKYTRGEEWKQYGKWDATRGPVGMPVFSKVAFNLLVLLPIIMLYLLHVGFDYSTPFAARFNKEQL
jgi:hypothetical protein